MMPTGGQRGFGLITIIVLVILGLITVGAGATIYKKVSGGNLDFALWVEEVLSGEKTDPRTIRQHTEPNDGDKKDTSGNVSIPGDPTRGRAKKYHTLFFSLTKWDTAPKQINTDSPPAQTSVTLHIQNYDIPMTFSGSVDPSGKVTVTGAGDLTVTVSQPRISGTVTTHYGAVMNGQVDESGKAAGNFTLTSTITGVTGNIPNNPKNDSDTFGWSGRAE